MKYSLPLRERPFEAIKNGTKKVEVRANKPPISEIRAGDTITFKKTGADETIECVVERITLYKTVRELLTAEGTKETLSSGKDLEEGIKSIESIGDYKETIANNGVFAIRVRPSP